MMTLEPIATQTIEVNCRGAMVHLNVHCNIEMRLFTRHEENPLLEMFSERLRGNDLVYDVGSHAGYHAVYMAAQLTSGKIVAFEPNPYCLEYLRENIALNPGLQIEVFAGAVAESDGTMSLSHGQAYEASARLGVRPDMEITQVPVTRLDTFARTNGCPNALKIDVEGAEGMVLRGAQNVLSNPTLRTIMLELHPTMVPGGEEECAWIRRTLVESGFRETYCQPRRQQFHLFYDR